MSLSAEDYRRVFIGAMALTVFDAVATAFLINAQLAYEANPIIASLIDSIGLIPAMIVRTTVGVAFLCLIYIFRNDSKLAKPGLLFVTLALTIVAIVHVTIYVTA